MNRRFRSRIGDQVDNVNIAAAPRLSPFYNSAQYSNHRLHFRSLFLSLFSFLLLYFSFLRHLSGFCWRRAEVVLNFNPDVTERAYVDVLERVG